MELLMIYLQSCILICFYLLPAYLHDNNHGYYILSPAFLVFEMCDMNENSLNDINLHYYLMIFL